MAKLNRTEIKAVANKTYNTLKKAAEERRVDVIKNYNPSEIYLKTIELSLKRDRLEKELDEIKDSLYDIGKEFNFWCGFRNLNTDEIKKTIINQECKLQELPSVEEIEDEVTIAAIDKHFDTDKFIRNFLIKFNS